MELYYKHPSAIATNADIESELSTSIRKPSESVNQVALATVKENFRFLLLFSVRWCPGSHYAADALTKTILQRCHMYITSYVVAFIRDIHPSCVPSRRPLYLLDLANYAVATFCRKLETCLSHRCPSEIIQPLASWFVFPRRQKRVCRPIVNIKRISSCSSDHDFLLCFTVFHIHSFDLRDRHCWARFGSTLSQYIWHYKMGFHILVVALLNGFFIFTCCIIEWFLFALHARALYSFTR